MDVKRVLEYVGLAGNEAKVYLALLDLGSALAGEITKRSGVNRTNVYDALNKLAEKGLASYVLKANRKYFEAASPERIMSYLDEREEEIHRKKDLFGSVLTDLEERRKLSREPQEATIYKGKKGLISVAEDVLNMKRELLVFGAEGRFVDMFAHYAEQWHARRGELQIPVKIIYNEKIRAKKSKANFPAMQMRFSDAVYDTPATTWIYGEKTAIIVWADQPIATLIRSKDVSDSYKQFFDILWSSSKE